MAQTEILKQDIGGCCIIYRFTSISKKANSMYRFKLDSTDWAYTFSNGFTKNKVRFEGNKVICTQKGKKEIEAVREFFTTHMIMTITCDGVTAKRFYTSAGQDDPCVYYPRCCVRLDNGYGKNNLIN